MSLQEYKMSSLKDKHAVEAQVEKKSDVKEKVEETIDKVKVKGRRLNK